MKTKILLLALALSASTCLLTAQDSNQRPDGQRPPGRQRGPGAPGEFHVLPPRAQQQLNLTADQQKQVAALEAEVKAKIEKILTPEQLEQLKQMRPPQGPGGPGGPGGQGGPGGEGRPQRPPQE
jgi:Spy/CpxP family protein refolding chaperone